MTSCPTTAELVVGIPAISLVRFEHLDSQGLSKYHCDLDYSTRFTAVLSALGRLGHTKQCVTRFTMER